MGIADKLDISDIVKCAEKFCKLLDNALKSEKDLAESKTDVFSFEIARGATIQFFEVSLELSWKMMQKWVEINDDKNIEGKPKRELFRVACRCGLIDDPVPWWKFFENRIKISYIYHEKMAEEVFETAKTFRPYLEDFLERLEERR
ncbi:MAG: nucleotidyltransferase substrate binding protein [Defluviitaleaceae bacterium]|nr:nucleotidyltransferase substrate binding protein [Defluviitaleaceae bacterium]